MLYKRKILFAKIEAAEDTAEAMAKENAIETRNLSVNLYQGNRVNKDIDRLALGAQESVNTNPHTVMAFDVLAAGAGAAGTVPGWGPLLRMCGLREVVDADTSVTYEPVSGGYESGTLEFRRPAANNKHQVYKTSGVRGEFGFELNAGQLPLLKFSNMMGTWYEPEVVAGIESDTSKFKEAIPAVKSNTISAQLDGYGCALSAFSVSMGNQLTRRDMPGSRSSVLSDRAISGQLTVLAPELSDKNYFEKLQSHNGAQKVALEVVHGTTAGNTLGINLQQIQLNNISETEVDGELAYQMDFVAIPTDAGDDEFSLVVK